MNFRLKSYLLIILMFLCIYMLFPKIDILATSDDVLVISTENDYDKLKKSLKDSGVKIISEYDEIGALSVIAENGNLPQSIIKNYLLEIEENIKFKLDTSMSVSNKGNFQTSEKIPDNLKIIKVDKAWEEGLKGKSVNIGIIDTGIDQHIDLDIAGGSSFVHYTESWLDDNGHGTNIAGIVGATENGQGIIGVAPQSNIYSLKALNSKGEGTLTEILNAIEWSIENKMDIINLSFGSNKYSKTLQRMINKAYEENVLVVAASGNTYGNKVLYPAAYENVIAVNAINNLMENSNFSSAGEEIEITAPGEKIESTGKNSSYYISNGTSYASSHVTGFLAILREKYPSFNNDQLRSKLREHTVDFSEKGRDNTYGFGVLEYKGDLEEVSNTEQSKIKLEKKSVNIETSSYIVMNKDTPIYINNNDKFAQVGILKKNQIFRKVKSNSDWHEIQYGFKKAYVKKEQTSLIQPSSDISFNHRYNNTNKYVYINESVNVYDNSSGALSVIATLNKGEHYPIAHDYGGGGVCQYSCRI